MKTTKLLICAVGVAAAVAAAKAKGQTLTAHLEGMSPVASVNGTIDNGSFIQEYPSGVLNFTDFDAFCVEPTEPLSFGDTLVYQIQNPGSLANYDTISRLIGGYLASAQTGKDAAAVQWAIWEVTTETLSSPSLLSGNVRIVTGINDDVAILANQYLANLSSYTPAAITFLSNDVQQDVVTWQAIPEPTSLGLVALSGLIAFRRRR